MPRWTKPYVKPPNWPFPWVSDPPQPICPKCDTVINGGLDRTWESFSSPIGAYICPRCHQEIWTYEPLEDTNAK